MTLPITFRHVDRNLVLFTIQENTTESIPFFLCSSLHFCSAYTGKNRISTKKEKIRIIRSSHNLFKTNNKLNDLWYEMILVVSMYKKKCNKSSEYVPSWTIIVLIFNFSFSS